jgi:hypothetical protein
MAKIPTAPIVASTLLLEKRGFPQIRAPKRLHFSLQTFNRFLFLTKGLFKLKPSINLTHQSDEDPQENGAKNNREKRKGNSWNFKPMIILNRDKKKVKDNPILILKTK